MSTDDYEVGYKKPPKANQFQKGHSGYKGRKRRKNKSLAAIIMNELEKDITITENGKKQRVSRKEVIIKKTVAKLLTTGDLKLLEKLQKLVPPDLQKQEQSTYEFTEFVNRLMDEWYRATKGYYSYNKIAERLGMDPHDLVDMLLGDWAVDAEDLKAETRRRYEEYLLTPAASKRPNLDEKLGMRSGSMSPVDKYYPDERADWDPAKDIP